MEWIHCLCNKLQHNRQHFGTTCCILSFNFTPVTALFVVANYTFKFNKCLNKHKVVLTNSKLTNVWSVVPLVSKNIVQTFRWSINLIMESIYKHYQTNKKIIWLEYWQQNLHVSKQYSTNEGMLFFVDYTWTYFSNLFLRFYRRPKTK